MNNLRSDSWPRIVRFTLNFNQIQFLLSIKSSALKYIIINFCNNGIGFDIEFVKERTYK